MVSPKCPAGTLEHRSDILQPRNGQPGNSLPDSSEPAGHPGAVSRAGLLAEAHRRMEELHGIEPEKDLPIDPNLARALALFEKRA